MFLLFDPKGGKYWRLGYRFAGKQKVLALGTYPEVSLKQARRARDKAREQLREHTDPAMVRRVEKLTAYHRTENSFEAVAREWHGKFRPTWTVHTAEKNLRILELNAFPWLGGRAIAEVTAPEVLALLRRAEERGLLDTAHRLRQVIGQVFRYAIATGRAQHDPSQALKGALPPRRVHMVPLAPAAIAILRDLHQLTGQGHLCIPGLANKERPMSENTVNLALRRLGYSGDEATANGFRSSFSTLAHGSGLWRPEVVEVQLAHKYGDTTQLAYDRGDFMDERRRLMPWWADECERLRQAAVSGPTTPRSA